MKLFIHVSQTVSFIITDFLLFVGVFALICIANGKWILHYRESLVVQTYWGWPWLFMSGYIYSSLTKTRVKILSMIRNIWWKQEKAKVKINREEGLFNRSFKYLLPYTVQGYVTWVNLLNHARGFSKVRPSWKPLIRHL